MGRCRTIPQLRGTYRPVGRGVGRGCDAPGQQLLESGLWGRASAQQRGAPFPPLLARTAQRASCGSVCDRAEWQGERVGRPVGRCIPSTRSDRRITMCGSLCFHGTISTGSSEWRRRQRSYLKRSWGTYSWAIKRPPKGLSPAPILRGRRRFSIRSTSRPWGGSCGRLGTPRQRFPS